ncbi:hypothetical protein ACSHT0_08050 [Tepidicaulis sp. LMO-SS28]|uniref:hypothetical protein n=1 Tax=Tepidicaulis sp. LMO-SS28 TaxID=3447455 RepID=UPI003EE00252
MSELVSIEEPHIQKAEDIKARAEHEKEARAVLSRQNKNFVQVYKRGWRKLRDLLQSDEAHARGAATLWILFAEHIDRAGTVVSTQGDLAEIMDCSERTIRRYLAVLKREKMLEIVRLRHGLTVFALDPSQVWISWDDKKEFATFFTKAFLGHSNTKRINMLIAKNLNEKAKKKDAVPEGEGAAAEEAA